MNPNARRARHVLVTGATRGLGLATALAFAELGDTVTLTGRDARALDVLVTGLQERGLRVTGVVLDVDSDVSVRCAAREVAQVHDRLDVLVNNAGILPEATEGTDAAFVDHGVLARTLQTNVLGAASVIDAFLPLLLRSEAGRVLNVSSTMGSLSDQEDPASPYYDALVPAYRASKAALNSLTIGLARTLEGTSVTALAVCPGFVQTELTPANAEQAPLTAEDSAAFLVEAADADRSSGSFVDRDGAVAW